VGACWAFSAAENMAGQWALAGHAFEMLSVQELVTCADTCCGVMGGWPYLAFEYVIRIGGIATSEAVPYCAGTGGCYPCMLNTTRSFCGPPPSYCNATWTHDQCANAQPAATFANWSRLTSNETELMAVLQTQGPLSVLMDAGWLQFYSSGIFNPGPPPLGCGASMDDLDHAVLLTGWGSLNGTDYWSAQNSWGRSWGLNGTFLIGRGGNVCGIATMPTTALVGE
jgi:cathepsin F